MGVRCLFVFCVFVVCVYVYVCVLLQKKKIILILRIKSDILVFFWKGISKLVVLMYEWKIKLQIFASKTRIWEI